MCIRDRDPRLPEGWARITWRMRWHGSRVRITVEQESVRLAVEVGDRVTLVVRGEPVDVGADEVVVPLDGQGPRLRGAPTSQASAASTPTDRRDGQPARPGGVVPHSIDPDDTTGPVAVVSASEAERARRRTDGGSAGA